MTYWGDVEKIRDNTILLCLLLLGGIKYDENELKEFDVFNDEYNRFIKSMLNVPNGINKFLFQYSGKDPIKVIRLYKRDTISYTKNGEIISNPMTFVRVENFDEADDEVFQTSYDRSKRISVTAYSVPENVWVCLRNGSLKKVEW